MRHSLPLAQRTFARAVAAFVLALAFVTGSALPSLAVGGLTGSLSGTILETGTQTAISGADIAAVSPSSRYTARTDAHGFFQINGMQVDTYLVTVKAAGHDTLSINGVTIQGDVPTDLQTVTLAKTLTQIGRTSARSQSSVYQPAQSTDSVTVAGARVTEALGKTASIDEQKLALSIPGVQLTKALRLTIRGGQSNEVGYQFDGVNFTEPFLSTNANTNRFNGLGSLQVVAGAGAASPGPLGGGGGDVVIKRGQRPPFGYLDLEAGAPNYFHQFAGEYGWSTPNGRLSNYTAVNTERFASYTANPAYGIPAEQVGNRFGASNDRNDDVVNNLVYRFGKDNGTSLQFLYQTRDFQAYGSNPAGRQYYQYDPYANRAIPTTGGYDPTLTGTFATPQQFFADRVFLLTGVPNFNSPPTQPELLSFTPSRFIKFELNSSLNATTFAALRVYNWEVDNGLTNNYESSTRPTDQITGGQRVGIAGELTKTFSDKHTAQIGFQVENAHPFWNAAEPFAGYQSALFNAGDPGMANIWDFVNPANVNAAISPANPCPINVSVGMPAGDPNGCYLYRTGLFGGTGVPRVPAFGIGYNKTDFQTFGLFVQDTWSPSKFIKAQLGLREDIGNFKQGQNPFNPTNLANPDDVLPSSVAGFFIKPYFLEPRGSLVYTNKDTAVRLGYGRSVVFPEAQTFGTPSSIYGADPRFFMVPAKGNVAGNLATYNCGSGYNPFWLPPGTTALTAPNGAIPGASPWANGGIGGFFQCQNYAQQIYWVNDQNFDAPDVGGNKPGWQGNTDLTVQHQFRNGVGARLTGYFRRGYDNANTFVISQVLDPVTGAPITQVFGVGNIGTTKTTGLELGLTSPQRAFGFSGYLTMTYTNGFSTVPPLISGEDNVPLVSFSSVALGNLYRIGFVSPFTVNAGAQYRTRSGWRLNPILSYDKGYPIGVGNLTATGGAVGGTINGVAYNIPQTNIGLAAPAQAAAGGGTGAASATNYVDPINPGNYFHPYIAATRGLPETSAAGGYLSRPRVTADMSLEYQRKRNTFGVLVSNLFGNVYGEPGLNPYWQPVATGVGGPNTGKNAAGFPTNIAYVIGGFRNFSPLRYGSQQYVEYPNGAPLGLRFYYQLAL
jgi:hypothetical protein